MDTTDGRRAVVIVDGANLAASHAITLADSPSAGRVTPSLAGLMLAVQWFRSRGHSDCFAFIPAYWYSTGPGRLPFQSSDWMKQAEALVKEGWAVGTPPSENDDLWIIDYAMQYGGFVCTNDLFRDHIADRTRRFGGSEAAALSLFCSERLIPYAWRSNREFLPQPIKARAALMAERPVTPEVLRASTQLPASVTAALSSVREAAKMRLPAIAPASRSNFSEHPVALFSPIQASGQSVHPESSASCCDEDESMMSLESVAAFDARGHDRWTGPSAVTGSLPGTILPRIEDLPAHLQRIVVAALQSFGLPFRPISVTDSITNRHVSFDPALVAAVVGACSNVYDRSRLALESAYGCGSLSWERREDVSKKIEVLASKVLESFATEFVSAAKLTALTRVPARSILLWSEAREEMLKLP